MRLPKKIHLMNFESSRTILCRIIALERPPNFAIAQINRFTRDFCRHIFKSFPPIISDIFSFWCKQWCIERKSRDGFSLRTGGGTSRQTHFKICFSLMGIPGSKWQVLFAKDELRINVESNSQIEIVSWSHVCGQSFVCLQISKKS